jgi:hypothetical protein
MPDRSVPKQTACGCMEAEWRRHVPVLENRYVRSEEESRSECVP